METGNRLKDEVDKFKYTMLYMCDKESDAESCHKLGYYYEVQEANYKKAREYYEDNCRKNEYPESCHKMGAYMLMERGGYKFQKQEGLDVLSKNCFDRELGTSCHVAGGAYFVRNLVEGVPNPFRDVNKAIQHFDKGCERGTPEACDYAGTIYAEGKHVPQNVTKALERFTKGCDAASLTSCKGAANIVKDGLNEVPRNDKMFKEFKEKFEFIAKSGMNK